MKSKNAVWMLALGVLWGPVSVAPAAEPAPLEVGTAVVDITPAEGQTHDPLLAKALFLRQGERQGALVVCDQVVVSRDDTTAIRRQSEEKIGIPAEHIAVTASHTHTGRRACDDFAERVSETGVLRLLHPTECVMDRLAWYFHDADRQCLEQAVRVAGRHSVNLRRIERWARKELPHGPKRFREFAQLLREWRDE